MKLALILIIFGNLVIGMKHCLKNEHCDQPGGFCIILVGNEGICNNSFVDLDMTTPIKPESGQYNYK